MLKKKDQAVKMTQLQKFDEIWVDWKNNSKSGNWLQRPRPINARIHCLHWNSSKVSKICAPMAWKSGPSLFFWTHLMPLQNPHNNYTTYWEKKLIIRELNKKEKKLWSNSHRNNLSYLFYAQSVMVKHAYKVHEYIGDIFFRFLPLCPSVSVSSTFTKLQDCLCCVSVWVSIL